MSSPQPPGAGPTPEDSPDDIDAMRRALLLACGSFATAAMVPAAASSTRASSGASPLSVTQTTALRAFADLLVPGAAAARVVEYVNAQLRADTFHSTLMLRYLDWHEPALAFYANGLDALDRAAGRLAAVPFAGLAREAADRLVRDVANGTVPDWTGPPAPLFLFVVRSDAVDVVYGTPAGFEQLGVDYFPHIAPPTTWPE